MAKKKWYKTRLMKIPLTILFQVQVIFFLSKGTLKVLYVSKIIYSCKPVHVYVSKKKQASR